MGNNRSIGVACFTILSLETFMGIFTNVFIIFIMSLHYFRHQKPVSGSDKIIAALSLSNICYACIAFSNILMFYFWPLTFVARHMTIAVFVAITFIFITSLWLTASLCFFYYIKIENFTSDFLSRLKTKISSLVPWMIFVSVALSSFSSSLNVAQFLVEEELSESNPTVLSINVSRSHMSPSGVFNSNLYILFICCFIPFLISVVTTASTAFSLHIHRAKMAKNKAPSSGNRRVNTYEDTIRTMIGLLIFYAMIYVILFLFYFNIFAPYSVGFWVFLVIMCSYGPTQSILLSLATTKLKEAWMKILHLGNESAEEDEGREG